MDEKHELFWRQGDFGYVKDVTDSLVTFCKQKEPVCTLSGRDGSRWGEGGRVDAESTVTNQQHYLCSMHKGGLRGLWLAGQS